MSVQEKESEEETWEVYVQKVEDTAVEVEADSREEVVEKAVKKAREEGHHYTWNKQGIEKMPGVPPSKY